MIGLRAVGIDRALGNLERTAKRLEDQFLSDAALARAEELVPIVRGRAPRSDTEHAGRLAATVRARRRRRTAAVVQAGAGIKYAGPIHFGWPAHHIEPQPFLWETGSLMESKIVENYEKALQKMLDEENSG